MQQANLGIQNMKGYDDEQFKSAFTIQENEGGVMEASILGNNVSSHDLEKKKEQIEEMKAFNFFSSLGKGLANMVTALTEKTIEFITGLVRGGS
jgi:hypothetical protein